MVQPPGIRLDVYATPGPGQNLPMPATDDDTQLPCSLPNICKKRVSAAFDGGQVSSDGGVLLLVEADKRLGLITTLAGLIPDSYLSRLIEDIPRKRVLAIACGYPDGNGRFDLRMDPAFAIAYGRLPDTGDDLALQPTMSRLKNAQPYVICSGFHGYESHKRPPKAIPLDVDDTAITAHGHQRMSLFKALR
jgi:hypothetical protein